MDCIFCKIIKGDIPSYTIYEDNIVKVFLDVNPMSPGHMLIIPKKHFENLDEIARKGIFLCNQLPCEIDGVTTADFLRTALNEKEEVSLYQYIKKIDSAVKDLKMDEKMIHRSMNKGFSGGEKNKNEILQLKVLEPKFIILDELDSGLDVDSLKIVCENINNYLKEHENTSVLIITHYPKILQSIKPDYVHVMVNGNIK